MPNSQILNNMLPAAIDAAYNNVLKSAGESAYALLILLDFLHGIAFFMYFSLVLTPRWPKKYNTLFVVLSSALLYTLPTYLSGAQNLIVADLPFSLRISSFTTGLLCFVCVLFLFKDSFFKKLLHLLIQFLIFITCDVVGSVIVMAGVLPEATSPYDMTPTTYILAKFLFAVAALSASTGIGFLFRRQQFPIRSRHLAVLAIFVTLETLMLYNTVYVQHGQFNENYFVWLLIEVLLCIIADTMVLHMLKTAAEKEDLEKQLTISQLQSVHTKQMEEDNAQLRMLRHDVKNTLATAELLLQKGNVQQAKEFLHGFHTDIDRESQSFYCQNPVANSVLLIKAQEAKKAGFLLRADVFCPSDIAVDSVDLCSIFSNLLDNAIDHADPEKDRVIYINAWQNKADYIIRCKNSLSPGKPAHNRRGKKNQGLGLGILKKTVKKYDGSVDVQKDENFTITLLLKVKNDY